MDDLGVPPFMEVPSSHIFAGRASSRDKGQVGWPVMKDRANKFQADRWDLGTGQK